MGIGFVILGLFGFFLLLSSIVLFFVFKKKGYIKTGIIVSTILALIVLIPIFSMIFESELYFKSNAKEDLKQIDVVLQNDFDIVSNEIVGLNKYYQITYLKISKEDRNRIINDIRKSNGFKIFTSKDSTLATTILNSENWRANKTEVWNYQIGEEFIKEYYHKREGYVAISITIKLKTNSDSLIINRIE